MRQRWKAGVLALLILFVLGPNASDVVGATRLASSGRIVFQSDRDGKSDIYSMKPDGTDVRRLTHTALNIDPRLSPNARTVAFASANRDGRDFEIYTMNADGTGVTRLTRHEGWVKRTPAFSPDGEEIAFVSWPDPTDRDGGAVPPCIYIITVNGTRVRPLKPTRAGPEMCARNPVFSPDGRRIAFVWDEHHVYLINADGTGLTRLTSHGRNYSPVFSPDGKRIAFASDRDTHSQCQDGSYIGLGCLEIYLMHADGSRPIRLTRNRRNDFPMAFSPDGRYIAFNADYLGHDYYGIYTMRVDGTGIRRLTRDPRNAKAQNWLGDWR